VTVGTARLTWLVRRLSRMYWQEVPYRAASVLRGVAQSKGYFDADPVPPEASDARCGRAWVTSPVPNVAEVCEIRGPADRILAGDLAVFGKQVHFKDGVPDWNADPVTGTHIGLDFGLSIDFRHVGEGVDIKFLWEVNRHLWWVPLAQQYSTSGDRRYLVALQRLLESWLDACPYARGPNWSSPVEHGIRLINWSIVWHLVGGEGSPMFEGGAGRRLRARWLDCIYQHIRFARDNYSLYSSADNHLIGEAAGVYVGALTWDRWSDVRRLRIEAQRVLERETQLQFSADGVNLEQALCYHKFSLQFLLASGLCARANGDDFSAAFWSRIEAATTFLASVMDCEGRVPSIGDSDDGEVWRLAWGADFNSYRSIVAIGAALFQRADLEAKAASGREGVDPQLPWLAGLSTTSGSPAALSELPTRFERGGYVILGEDLHARNEFRVTFDCGALGYNRIAGHGHADALSVLVSWGGVPLLVDPGTYCYNAAPEYRHFFRGTHAHNTLVVDGEDQSEYGASFLWLRDVACTLVHDSASGENSIHAFHDGYRRLADPVTHHRRVTLGKAGDLVVEDWIECQQAHDIELLWHAANGAHLSEVSSRSWTLESGGRVLGLSIDGPSFDACVVQGRESPPQGWMSEKFYQRSPAPVLSVSARLSPGQVLRTVIDRGVARLAPAGGQG